MDGGRGSPGLACIGLVVDWLYGLVVGSSIPAQRRGLTCPMLPCKSACMGVLHYVSPCNKALLHVWPFGLARLPTTPNVVRRSRGSAGIPYAVA